MIKVLQKMQREHIKSIEVKKEVCDDWSDYIDAYFQGTVYSEKVSADRSHCEMSSLTDSVLSE